MGRVALIAIVVAFQAAPTAAQVVLPPNLGVPPAASTVPGMGYDAALAALAAGDYPAALDLARGEYAAGIKIGADRWIDSIASAALLGESLLETGRFGDALARYEEALLLAAAHPAWLLSVRFPPQPPQPSRRTRAANWGRSERNTQPAALPEVVTIRQQGSDAQDVLQRGGVLASPYDRPLRVQEIIRPLVIALYRTGSLLGELAPENAPLDAATRGLIRRPAPPQHYSQAWIDIALGTALWAQGKADQAQPLLTRGLIIGNNLDHAVTAWGLIVLGRIALDADQAARAATLFEEATYAAADQGDFRALEEAFALAFSAQRAAGTRQVPPSIVRAAEWARGGPAALRARLLAMQAEALADRGDSRGAAAALKAIDGRLLQGEAGRGVLGGRVAYAAALNAYAGGDLAGGDAELDRALAIARPRSPRLFRTQLLVEILRAGSSVADRQADAWFKAWLADPAARDYALDPLDTLAVHSAPREAAFDAWVVVAGRRGQEQALEAAEATMRNRWLESRPLGGRRLAVERLLTADPRSLEPVVAARRAALIATRPGLDNLLAQSRQLRGRLEATAAAAGQDPPALPGEAADWQAYGACATQLTRITAALAAGHEAAPPLFPPLTPAPEIRRRLEPGQALLSFHWTSSGLFGALEYRDRLLAWQVRQAAGLPNEIRSLAKALLLTDKATPVPADRLAAGDWQGSAARIERMLFENSRGVSLAEGIEELVIVPDGWLWYLPFEILPITSNRGGGDRRPLREVCRIRYAPTRSLAVMRFEPRPAGTTGILVGRPSRAGNEPEAAAARMAAGVERAVRLEVPASGPAAALVGSIFDALVIHDESVVGWPVGATPLLAPGQGRSGLTLGDWREVPAKRPQLIVLPGLQTAMGGGLAKTPARAGEDVFLVATDLLAAGASKVLMSRWRTGGGVTTELLREFLQETAGGGGTGAVEAWQRAVDLVTAERPDLDREPRLKPGPAAEPADARHPLFWAGFLLIDLGTGIHEEPPAAAVPARGPLAPAGPPLPAVPAPPPAAPPAAPGGPPPPAILAPPPPRPDP